MFETFKLNGIEYIGQELTSGQAIKIAKYGDNRADVAFSNKFRYNVVRLFGVPYFEGIYIHKGNTEKDSLGCIIVGYNDKKGWVSRPTEAMNKIMEAIKDFKELKVIIK